jgi:cold shock protein
LIGVFLWYNTNFTGEDIPASLRIILVINNEGQSFGLWSVRAKGVTVATGKVKWFNGKKGFGFIIPDEGGEELFVHHSEIKMGGYADLQEGQAVSYDVGQGKKGPCAVNVVPK